MQAQRQHSTILVPFDNFEEFERRLVKLNAKAAKFGLSPIQITSMRIQNYFYAVSAQGRDGELIVKELRRLKPGSTTPRGERVVRIYEIQLDYPIVKLGDWRVVAQIEKLTPQNNLVFVVSPHANEAAFAETHRQCVIACEHCNTKRSRKLSYILASEAGEGYKEVGSTCLQDFTGINPAAALFLVSVYECVRAFDYMEALEDGTYSGRVTSVETAGYLADVAFLTEQFGFVSATKARDSGQCATYAMACSMSQLLRDSALYALYIAELDRHRATAAAIIDWFSDNDASGSFEQNVKLLLSQPDILLDNKHLAFCAASIVSYQNHLKRQREQAMEIRAPSQHVGAKGDKLEAAVNLNKIVSFETQYGWGYRVNVLDAEGNRLSWRTSNPPQELLEVDAVGKTFLAKFKIKDHSEYKGVLSTDISHLKFQGWQHQAPAAQA